MCICYVLFFPTALTRPPTAQLGQKKQRLQFHITFATSWGWRWTRRLPGVEGGCWWVGGVKGVGGQNSPSRDRVRKSVQRSVTWTGCGYRITSIPEQHPPRHTLVAMYLSCIWQPKQNQPPWGSPMICCCCGASLQIQFVSDASMLLSGQGEWLEAQFHRPGNG